MKKILSVALALLLVFGLCSASDPLPQASAKDVGTNAYATVDCFVPIAPGITKEHIVTYKSFASGRNNHYVATIDFSCGAVGMLAGYGDYDATGNWSLQPLTEQIKAAENSTGKNIVLAVNGDFYLEDGEPCNTLIMHGQTVKSWGRYYFAVLKYGTPVIRKGDVPTDDVQEAVGTNGPLLTDGENVCSKDDSSLAPRTAIGITADGLVKVLVTDGRNEPYNVGATLYETAEMMRSLGCVDALYLDGGGSSTFCSECFGRMRVNNSPSDGFERPVSSTLLFYTTCTEETTSVFTRLTKLIERIMEMISKLLPVC